MKECVNFRGQNILWSFLHIFRGSRLPNPQDLRPCMALSLWSGLWPSTRTSTSPAFWQEMWSCWAGHRHPRGHSAIDRRWPPDDTAAAHQQTNVTRRRTADAPFIVLALCDTTWRHCAIYSFIASSPWCDCRVSACVVIETAPILYPVRSLAQTPNKEKHWQTSVCMKQIAKQKQMNKQNKTCSLRWQFFPYFASLLYFSVIEVDLFVFEIQTHRHRLGLIVKIRKCFVNHMCAAFFSCGERQFQLSVRLCIIN